MFLDTDPDRSPSRTDLVWIKKEYTPNIVEIAGIQYGGYT